MSGRKMAKSAGNFQRITELAEQGVEPLAFRYLCLTARYARKLDYSDASLAGAAAALASLREVLRRLGPPPADGPWTPPPPLRAGAAPARPVGLAPGIAGHGGEGDGTTGAASGRPARKGLGDRAGSPAAPLSAEGRRLHDAFVAAIDDDLDMPSAVKVAREIASAEALSPDERRWLLLDLDAVLGLDLDRVWDATPLRPTALPDGAAVLMEQRTGARAARDFATADRLRDELRALGVEPIDNADGSSDWRPTERS
jgi:cysteinyl-tRNA synthetase